jgi:hypothetical protein
MNITLTVNGQTKTLQFKSPPSTDDICRELMRQLPGIWASPRKDGSITIYRMSPSSGSWESRETVPPSQDAPVRGLNRKERRSLKRIGAYQPTNLDRDILRETERVARLLRPGRHRGGLRRNEPGAWVPRDDTWALRALEGHLDTARAVYRLGGLEALSPWMVEHLGQAFRRT